MDISCILMPVTAEGKKSNQHSSADSLAAQIYFETVQAARQSSHLSQVYCSSNRIKSNKDTKVNMFAVLNEAAEIPPPWVPSYSQHDILHPHWKAKNFDSETATAVRWLHLSTNVGTGWPWSSTPVLAPTATPPMGYKLAIYTFSTESTLEQEVSMLPNHFRF